MPCEVLAIEPAIAGGNLVARILPGQMATTSPLRIPIPLWVALAQLESPSRT
jgi:hypothetical protein